MIICDIIQGVWWNLQPIILILQCDSQVKFTSIFLCCPAVGGRGVWRSRGFLLRAGARHPGTSGERGDVPAPPTGLPQWTTMSSTKRFDPTVKHKRAFKTLVKVLKARLRLVLTVNFWKVKAWSHLLLTDGYISWYFLCHIINGLFWKLKAVTSTSCLRSGNMTHSSSRLSDSQLTQVSVHVAALEWSTKSPWIFSLHV